MNKNVAVPKAELEAGFAAAKRLNEELKGKALSYHIESYGCQMNAHDSEKIAGLLSACGYAPASEKEEADLILFNTCCVREHAEKRVFGNIGALKKKKDEKPALLIGVCGCMMQQKEVADRLFQRFPFVDLIFGTNELHLLPAMLEQVLSGERVEHVRKMDGEIAEGLPVLREEGVSQFVTIMYGCDNFCSYCIVPYVRGRERSRSPEHILNEMRALGAKGCKEITLLGQNVNSYSNENSHDNEGVSFPALLKMAAGVEGVERIRFMTSHPKDLSDELIEVMAREDKVCPHVHLPVQSGSDRVLAQMNRRYDRAHYFSLVEKLRANVADVELTTDIIVGFPGETEEDFCATLDLVERVGFSAAYTFKYSPRTGTKAAGMPDQIEETIKAERLARLNETVAKGLRTGNEKYVGRESAVLVEGCDHRGEPRAFGKLPNFKMVYFPGDESLRGEIVPIRITGVAGNSLIGERK